MEVRLELGGLEVRHLEQRKFGAYVQWLFFRGRRVVIILAGGKLETKEVPQYPKPRIP